MAKTFRKSEWNSGRKSATLSDESLGCFWSKKGRVTRDAMNEGDEWVEQYAEMNESSCTLSASRCRVPAPRAYPMHYSFTTYNIIQHYSGDTRFFPCEDYVRAEVFIFPTVKPCFNNLGIHGGFPRNFSPVIQSGNTASSFGFTCGTSARPTAEIHNFSWPRKTPFIEHASYSLAFSCSLRDPGARISFSFDATCQYSSSFTETPISSSDLV